MELNAIEKRVFVSEIYSRLNNREKVLLYLLTFKRQRQIAEFMDLNESRISQMKNKLITKIRRMS
jgi:DNA-directed RNA polymerase specialized sigma subunit